MMKIDKLYLRKSIIDGQYYPQDRLVRFAKSKDGIVEFDPNKNKKGRGAYCLKENEVIEEVLKKRLLNRAFKKTIEASQYEKLRDEVNIWQKTQIKEDQTLNTLKNN